MSEVSLSPGGFATLACALEVSASKVGNVHRGADFEDVGLNDFLASGIALGQVIDARADASVGQTVLLAVELTRQLAGSNTNLGIILLLVPLAKAMAGGDLNSSGVSKILSSCRAEDAEAIFAAIRLANPGGLGSSERLDVTKNDSASNGTLLEAMQLAAHRDLVAKQYVNGFEQVFDEVRPSLGQSIVKFPKLSEAIVVTQLLLMAKHRDSLIERKCGKLVASEVQARAAAVVDWLPQTADDLAHERFWSAVGEFDFWLRSDGHRRNPGTIADLIAAGLFVALAKGDIAAPFG